jgi:hypothetical protein
MALFTGTYTRHAVIGAREKLADRIFDISPVDTPAVSSMKRESINGSLFEWQTDSLAAAAANAQLEGEDYGSGVTASTATVRVGNYMQISSKTLGVSGTLEAVDKAGRKSELAYQLARRGSEIKRDMEFTVFSNVAGSAGSTTQARVTATLGAWLKTNTNAQTTANDPTYTSGVPAATRTDATTTLQRAFTETILKDVAQSIWTAGGTLKNLFCGPYNKTVVSGFTGVVTRNFDMSNVSPKPTAVIAAADVYVTDFGTLKVIPNRFMRERDAYFLDFDYLSLAVLRNFRIEKLAKTGDAEKRLLLIEWGLKVKQEAALGGAFDLTTS